MIREYDLQYANSHNLLIFVFLRAFNFVDLNIPAVIGLPDASEELDSSLQYMA